MKAIEFLKDKGIHPVEPIYWDLEKRQITLAELLEEYAQSQAVDIEGLKNDFDLIVGRNSEITDDTHMDLVNEIVDHIKSKLSERGEV